MLGYGARAPDVCARRLGNPVGLLMTQRPASRSPYYVCVRYPGRRLDNLGDESQWVRRIMILYFMGPNEVHYLMLDQNLILEHPSQIYLKPNSRLIMFDHPVDAFSAEHQTVCVALRDLHSPVNAPLSIHYRPLIATPMLLIRAIKIPFAMIG